jgi:hypothetical protein
LTFGGVWGIIQREGALPEYGDAFLALRKDTMYKIFMIVGIVVLGIGWIAYGIWIHKVRQEEKNQPKPVSQRLQKTRSEVLGWAQKMKNFESPREQARKRKLQAEQNKDKPQDPTS